MGGAKTYHFCLLRHREVDTFSSKHVEFVVEVDAILVVGGGGIKHLLGIENPEHLKSKQFHHYFVFLEHVIGTRVSIAVISVQQLTGNYMSRSISVTDVSIKGELHSKLTLIRMKGDLKANCTSFLVF